MQSKSTLAVKQIPFRDTGYFSGLICDYLDRHETTKPLFNRYPELDKFKDQIEEKTKNYNPEFRSILIQSLLDQYKATEISSGTQSNILSLKDHNTFTITTGHQLNLFTGPLYFLYKIISTINLTTQLKKAYPDFNFVPVYWMASEDHDFEEINYFNFQGKKVQWSVEGGGAAGRLNTRGLDLVNEVYSGQLGNTDTANFLKSLFKEAYTTGKSLSEATRLVANALFADHGLVILDADCADLKKLFIPYLKMELVDGVAESAISKTNSYLKDHNYKIQVNPRPINLFYLAEKSRERIIKNGNNFSVNNTDLSWNKDEFIEELESNPERFSPNAIMRPLYQEVILPNLTYIGGGGELAYWLQLKAYFKSQDVTFPMLLLRNSVLFIRSKQLEKVDKLNLTIEDLFLSENDLLKTMTSRLTDVPIDLSSQKDFLKQQFKAMYDIAERTDKSFKGAVAAQERKQIKGLEHLEKRLLKAEKRRLQDQLNRIKALQDELFPSNGLQERQLNFSEVYLEIGPDLIQYLIKSLDPLLDHFLILELE